LEKYKRETLIFSNFYWQIFWTSTHFGSRTKTRLLSTLHSNDS